MKGTLQRRADHRDPTRAGGRGGANRRGVPAARDLECWRVAVELRFYIPASEIISRIKA